MENEDEIINVLDRVTTEKELNELPTPFDIFNERFPDWMLDLRKDLTPLANAMGFYSRIQFKE